MNRTYTPELSPAVLDRLDRYAEHFRADFNRPRQVGWCGIDLHGLLTDGEVAVAHARFYEEVVRRRGKVASRGRTAIPRQ